MTSFNDDTTLCWPSQSGTSSYEIARSTDASFSPCGLLDLRSSTCRIDADDPAPGQAYFYLVRPLSPFARSWGADSAEQERFLSCQ